MRNHVLAVVGAQYGSEGKGVIVNSIANEYMCHVRTGGPNAGHSFLHNGKQFVMQVIPCGWTNPDAVLIIGRGMLLDLDQMEKEINFLEENGIQIRNRLFVDKKCGILSKRFHQAEGGVQGELHQRIGSTGEGVGAARIARIERDINTFCLAKDYNFGSFHTWLKDLLVDNTPALIQNELHTRGNVLLEGTQGSGLSLIHGSWPYVTSHDTNAAQLAADAGVPPHLVTKTILVARTFPIRVAGNSGPLQNERTWEEMSNLTGRPVEERTTVTKKIRRVGLWDEDLFTQSMILNQPSSIALTFMDYMTPESAGVKEYEEIGGPGKAFIERLESRYSVPVSLIGTGGPELSVIRTRKEL